MKVRTNLLYGAFVNCHVNYIDIMTWNLLISWDFREKKEHHRQPLNNPFISKQIVRANVMYEKAQRDVQIEKDEALQ